MSLLNSINSDNVLDTLKKKLPEIPLLKLKDVPVVFLSYDEPNADENYQHLVDSHPNKDKIFRM